MFPPTVMFVLFPLPIIRVDVDTDASRVFHPFFDVPAVAVIVAYDFG
jgi:hypothetical protein